MIKNKESCLDRKSVQNFEDRFPLSTVESSLLHYTLSAGIYTGEFQQKYMPTQYD